MAFSREKKERIVGELEDAFSNAESVVFVAFTGMTVADSAEMRADFKSRGARYRVIKKTLLNRVLDGREIPGDKPELSGELAIAYSTEDAVAPAQAVAAAGKKYEDRIMPLGGVFEGRYIAAQEVKALAAIPSREVLYGQLVTVMNAPIQQTAGVLSNVVSSFVVTLNQIAQQKA